MNSRDICQGKLQKMAAGCIAHGVDKNDEHDEEAHDEETSLRGQDGQLIGERNWKVVDCCVIGQSQTLENMCFMKSVNLCVC